MHLTQGIAAPFSRGMTAAPARSCGAQALLSWFPADVCPLPPAVSNVLFMTTCR